MRPGPVPAMLAVLLAAAAVRGQDAAGDAPEEAPGPGAEADVKEGQRVDVIVTASKHGQKITEAPAAVTVLTSEEIAASGATSIADLFRRVPGLDIMQTSARDYNVNARGFNNTLSRRLLVLVDGRSVYLDLLGFILWDGVQVTLEDIERIEIVRGPGSALYGANASSGVVNIITKAPGDVGGTFAHVAYGELATLDAGILHGGEAGRLGYKVAASYYQTDAFENPTRDPDSEFQRPGETATRQPKATFRLQLEPGEDARWVLDGGYGASSGTLYTGIGPLDIQPGSYAPFLRTSYTRGGLFLQAFWNGLDGETLNLTSLQTNHFTTNAYDVEAQYNASLGSRHFVVVGGSVRMADIASDLTSRDETELNVGVYAQDEIKLGDRVTASVALRLDHDELVGVQAAPKAGLVIAPTPKQSIRLNVATAYNSSSFVESYLDYVVKIPLPSGGTLDVAAHGNPDLEPERVISVEAGYRAYPLAELMLDANVFHAKLQDFVQFIAVEFYGAGIPKTYTYINAGEASETGIELAAEYYASEAIALSACYAYTDVTQDEEVSDVTASHKGSLSVQYRWGKRLWGSLGATYSSRLEFPESTAFYAPGTIPAFTVVNGSVYWNVREDGSLALGLRGTNLLDNRHQEFIAGDYLERKLLAEVKLRF